MPHILDGFDDETKDALLAVAWDVREGRINEGFYPPEVNYLFWATCTDGRNTSTTPWMVRLSVHLASLDAQLFCEEDKDSFGDWLVVHGLWDGDEAA